MTDRISNRVAVIGISPRNGFFTQENISFLVQSTLDTYERAAAMIADIPAVSNWLALGYSESKAKTRARLDGNNYRHRVERACGQNNAGPDRLLIMKWADDIENVPEYRSNYQKIRKLYETSQLFRNAARETTGHFLDTARQAWNNRTYVIDDMEKAIDKAVHYLLAELAFLESAPAIYKADGIDFVYHRPMEIYDRYRNGEFDGVRRPHLGMRVLERS